VCSPSRAGLLTRRNQPRFGYDNNLAENQKGYDPEYAGLPVTEKTIADRLKSLGYVNGLVGKWHLGTRPQFHPYKRGFDHFWGFLGGGHDYFKSSPDGSGYQAPIECSYKQPEPITCITGQVRGVPHETMQWRFTISAAIRSGQWKLIRLPDRLPLLYDLSTDISEQHDLAIQNLGLVQSMLKDLGQWDVRLPHPVCLEGAVWKRRQLALYDVQYPLTQPEAN
jgi:arylsulfatase A-like enzyme